VQVAVLTRRPQGYFITHVEGAARPSVNGQQIGPAPTALKDHDVIELAGVKMEFFLKDDGGVPRRTPPALAIPPFGAADLPEGA